MLFFPKQGPGVDILDTFTSFSPNKILSWTLMFMFLGVGVYRHMESMDLPIKRFWMWITMRFGPQKDPLTKMINLKIWHDVCVLVCEWPLQIVVTLSIPLFHMFLPPDHLSRVKSNCLSVLSLFVCFILECKEWISPKDPRYNSIRHTFRGLIKNIHICMCLSVLQRWH